MPITPHISLKRRYSVAAATAAMVALAVAGSTTPVMAAPARPASSIAPTRSASSTFVVGIRDRQTGRCLDSNANGNVYTTWPCQAPGNHYQDWIPTIYPVNTGVGNLFTVSYRDYATGRCLDSNYAGNVYTTWPCQAPGNTYQLWFATAYNNPALFGIGTDADWQTARCLDSNANGNAYTLLCNGGNFQNWQEIGGWWL